MSVLGLYLFYWCTDGPELDEGPVSQEVEHGSAVVLACAATANPPPVYTWDTPAAGNLQITSTSKYRQWLYS